MDDVTLLNNVDTLIKSPEFANLYIAWKHKFVFVNPLDLHIQAARLLQQHYLITSS
jgi:hypothetical protein